MSDLYQFGNHPDGVRAICKDCERVVLKDTEEEAWGVVEDHNEQMHDGEEVAGVCEWDVEEVPVPDIDPDEFDLEKLFNLAAIYGEM